MRKRGAKRSEEDKWNFGTDTARPVGRSQKELLRVLCVFELLTQRPRSVSVISAFSILLTTENTEKKRTWNVETALEAVPFQS